jgi:F-type H+-transporting ATPase subunit epsilon
MSLELEILVPDGVVLHRRVSSLQATDASGRFGLLPGHQAFLTLLAPCVLVYRDEAGREGYAAADGGILLLEKKDRLFLVTREAVVAERLEDVAAAAAALLAARRAQEKAARAEFTELQTTLLRELRKVEKHP